MAELPGDRLASYLRSSLELLEGESPVHLEAVRRELGGRCATIRVDAEPVLTVSLAGPPWVTRGGAGAVEIRVSAENLELILAGHTTLEDAVRSGQLDVRGEVDAMVGFLNALHAWLHGALRSASLARLHVAYLRGASGDETPTH